LFEIGPPKRLGGVIKEFQIAQKGKHLFILKQFKEKGTEQQEKQYLIR